MHPCCCAPSEPVSPSRRRSSLDVAIQTTAKSLSMKLQPPPCLAVARVATAASHRQREALPTLLPNRARFTD
ncbi:hypothetical protein S245_027274 [Arachis hypogaea]